jgi:hypothetical protein
VTRVNGYGYKVEYVTAEGVVIDKGIDPEELGSKLADFVARFLGGLGTIELPYDAKSAVTPTTTTARHATCNATKALAAATAEIFEPRQSTFGWWNDPTDAPALSIRQPANG